MNNSISKIEQVLHVQEERIRQFGKTSQQSKSFRYSAHITDLFN